MMRLSGWCLAGVSLTAALSLAAQDPDANEVAQNIALLADDDFSVRTKAEQTLQASSEAILPQLEKAAESKDEEVASRVRRVAGLIKGQNLWRKMEKALGEERNSEVTFEWTNVGGDKGSGKYISCPELKSARHEFEGSTIKLVDIFDGKKSWRLSHNTRNDEKHLLINEDGWWSIFDDDLSPHGMLKKLKTRFVIKAYREDELDNRRVYVLETEDREAFLRRKRADIEAVFATSAESTRQVIAERKFNFRYRLFIDAETFFIVRRDLLAEKDREEVITLLSGHKLGLKLDPKIFEYVVPEGAQILDQRRE